MRSLLERGQETELPWRGVFEVLHFRDIHHIGPHDIRRHSIGIKQHERKYYGHCGSEKCYISPILPV